MTEKTFTIEEIARSLNGEVIGDGNCLIRAVAPLVSAAADEISFLSNPKLKSQLSTTLAGCVLVSEAAKDSLNANGIVLKDPYLGFARVAQLLDSTPIQAPIVHSTAVIEDNVSLGSNVAVGAGCVIEPGSVIGNNVAIGANCVIGQDCQIGEDSRLCSNVTLYHNVKVGRDCILQSGAVIGADGFGYANDKGHWIRIPQTGGVVIGDGVDIGANACIDRGALENTVIGNGVKIDNLCHIAHNVVIGEHTAMAGFTGIAGSATIGKNCTFSGRSSILGHLDIADGTHVTACSLINRSNKTAGVFSSGTGMQDNKTWRKNVARFRQLDDMARQLKSLQKAFDKLSQEKAE